MSLEFSFEIRPAKKENVPALKDFAIRFFQFIDFADENINNSSNAKCVRGEYMSDDGIEALLEDFGCGFAQELAKQNMDVQKFYVFYEDVFIGVGSIKNGRLEYEAHSGEGDGHYDEETDVFVADPDYKVSGTSAEGYVVEKIPFDEEGYERLCEEIYE